MKVSKNLLAACLVAFSFVAQAQTLLDEPSPKSTTIVITMDSIPPAEAYRMAARLLLDTGYALSQSDESLFYLSTDWGEKKGFWLIQYSFNINVRPSGGGSQVRLTGKWRQPNNTADTKAMLGGNYSVSDIQKRTNGGKYFEAMQAIADALGGEVFYL